MLLRISLVVSILAGAATLYFSHFQVAERITTLTSDLDTSRSNEQSARQAETAARSAEKEAKDNLSKAVEELATTSEQLETTTASLAVQQKRANELFEELTTTTRERNQSRQELAAYRVIGFTPDQLRTLSTELKQLTAEKDTYIAENQILLRKITQLEFDLSRYVGPREQEVELPVGLKGRVLAVDPKYDFVVLNIGGNQGVLANGKMLVNREGKLIAKVRITKVEADRSIANILPEWKQADVSEGDQVLY